MRINPNEVGYLFRYPRVPPEPRYVGLQFIHHDPSTALGEKFDVCPPQPAGCPSHNRDLPLQRDSFGHLAILLWGPQNVGGLATVRFAPRTTAEASFHLPVPFSPLASRADMNLSGCLLRQL